MSYPNDGWALCPDDGPHRVVRQQPPHFFPTADLVCVWDKERNILHVNRALFASLSTEQQSRVLRTRHLVEYISTPTIVSPFNI